MNLMLKETDGYIIGEEHSSGEYYTNVDILDLSKGLTHKTGIYSYSEMFYRYEVNQKLYEKSKISNVLIFPEIKHDNKKIKVYYNKYTQLCRRVHKKLVLNSTYFSL
jgi:hypothetical protein